MTHGLMNVLNNGLREHPQLDSRAVTAKKNESEYFKSCHRDRIEVHRIGDVTSTFTMIEWSWLLTELLALHCSFIRKSNFLKATKIPWFRQRPKGCY